MSGSLPPSAPASDPKPAPRKAADWGGKAIVVFALAFLMAVPGVFVFALIAERSSRSEQAVAEVSALQGGSQRVLGPMLAVPYAFAPNDKGEQAVGGWYLISPETGSAKLTMTTETRHRGLFEVPVYAVKADIEARFGDLPAAYDLPTGATLNWSQARWIMGFSDLRGAKSDILGSFTPVGAAAAAAPGGPLAFAPASGIDLGAAINPSVGDPRPTGMGLVSAPAGPSAQGPGTFRASFRFTGAQRLAVLPFAKSTHVEMVGDWGAPSFDGGFLPETRNTAARNFSAVWNVPFIARGLAAHGVSGALNPAALAEKDTGVSLVQSNNPYKNVTRALKYAVMFVGLVFLTFFVFEALSGRRVHPAQYILIGLAQMVFYLLLLSVSELIGFDLAFAAASVPTVLLIGLYAGWAFKGRAYQIQALVIFSTVYGLIYLLMRLEDFALLAGSLAAFIGLSAAMWLTRNIEWYGAGAAQPAPPAPQVVDRS